MKTLVAALALAVMASACLNGIDRIGTCMITIERPGYHPWVLGGIDVVSGVCGLVTVQLRADLIPL